MADFKDDVEKIETAEDNFKNRVSNDLVKRKLGEALENSDDEDGMQVVVDQLIACGFDDATTNLRELKALPQVLKDGETILMATSCIYTKNDHYVLLVVTDQRMFALSNRELLGIKTFNIPYEMVTKVVVHYGILTSIMRLDTDASAYRFMNVDNIDIMKLIYMVGTQIDQDKIPLVEKDKQLLNFGPKGAHE